MLLFDIVLGVWTLTFWSLQENWNTFMKSRHKRNCRNEWLIMQHPTSWIDWYSSWALACTLESTLSSPCSCWSLHWEPSPPQPHALKYILSIRRLSAELWSPLSELALINMLQTPSQLCWLVNRWSGLMNPQSPLLSLQPLMLSFNWESNK